MKTKLTKTQIFILIFFIFMLLFLFLSLLLIIIAGKEIYYILSNNHQLGLVGTSGFGVEKGVQNFPYVFFIIEYGFNFIFTMQIKNAAGEVFASNVILLYQIGYFFLVIMIPICALGFFISILVFLLKQKKPTLKSENSSDNNDGQLLDDLKTNMNQIQEYLIKLHKDVKTLKKITGIITPKSVIPNSTQVNDNPVDYQSQDLDLIQAKQTSRQQNSKIINQDELEQTNSGIERPKSLVNPTEYIMPKRDENFVNNFPTQQFLSTEMLSESKNEKKLSLSAIFDRKKIQTELEQDKIEVEEQINNEEINTFSLQFNDPTIIENQTFHEKVGFNLNNFDYTADEHNNSLEIKSIYQVGDRIIDNAIEYEIILVVPHQQNDTVMYELTLKSTEDGTIKSLMRE
ncbi:hypothetical protein [Spiroplasma melliferum]|uniref:Transmembrane protein n=2 Tax=Spiroplasma melliferum TaxID=2134 RepID=A0AAI9X1U4_SPIME|nr:hypothetical protein [Spiroplasma melliferum]ELL44547.1 hypothetical protein SMIPMB4A_v3c5320 [Spiroplasma melliferum IPMB4A]KAI93190.1 hypothetical protein SPM_003875 [Spiroplasma melliferum KC3]QCO23977.1 hypothetical protein SRED_002457 [Spiroplasma melliferum]